MKLYSQMTTEEKIQYCAESADAMRRVRGSVESIHVDGNITAISTAASTRVWLDGVEVPR